MDKKLVFLLIVGLCGVFMFSSGCISEETSHQIASALEGATTNVPSNQSVPLTKGQERISVESALGYWTRLLQIVAN
jgi:hypothetical protein